MVSLLCLTIAIILTLYTSESNAQYNVYSSNVLTNNCHDVTGPPVCCAALSHSYTKKYSRRGTHHHQIKGINCTIIKEYVSSPYERRHLHIAHQISTVVPETLEVIKKELFSVAEIEANIKWLDRVKTRMHSDSNSSKSGIMETPDDIEYLSYFEITKTCHSLQAVNIVKKWKEWIEPLSMHTRHPFTYPKLLNSQNVIKQEMNVDVCNVDYIILLTEDDFQKHHTDSTVTRKGFVFDAGCADNFDSSSKWLSCGYAQQGIPIDHVFGWEMRAQNVSNWLASVPQFYSSKMNFYNEPISSDINSKNNPFNIIKSLTKPEDFVAFKLDVDNESVEKPLLYQLLNDPQLQLLVDEFFYELEYTCTVLGRTVADMTRGKALKVMKDIRALGIRIHAWP